MSVVDEVKARLDVVELVGSYVPLQQSGKSFKANCPFHTERTPSFYVFPERGTWRCFGACATGGDAFSFLQRIEKLTFGEALRRLAEQVGVQVEAPRVKDERKEREESRLYTVLQHAADYFHRILVYSPAGEEARRYLAGRGVSDESIEAFQLGLSPSAWEGLRRHLTELGYSDEEMLTAGLITPREGPQGAVRSADASPARNATSGAYDRFRGRLMFPIRDIQGRSIGFGARSMDGSHPKYLNSPQTPLFDKGGVLYALDRAQDAIRKQGLAVLVEGYMDAVGAHQAGFDNVVAVMGTSLTERQVGQLKRSAQRFALALDPDAAGEEATRRSLEGAWHILQRTPVRVTGAGSLTLRQEIPDLRVISLPPGLDPDEVIRADPQDWRRRVDEATPILEYLIRWEASRPEAATPTGKLTIVDRVFPLIASLENPFEQEAAFKRLAEALGVEERALEAAAGRPRRRRRGGSLRAVEATTSALAMPAGDLVEEHLLGLVLRYGEEALQLLPELDPDGLMADGFQHAENAELWRVLTRADAVEEAEAIVSARAEELRARLQVPLEGQAIRRALFDLTRRLQQRRLKAQEEEAALVASGIGGDSLSLEETMRQQFIERTARIRALERGRVGRTT